MNRQLVEVIWHDAWMDDDNFATAHGIAQNHGPMTVHTLGWVIHEDEIGISVANERSTDGDGEVYRGRTFIPRGMIISVTPFRLSKQRKPKPPPEPVK